MLFRSLGMRRLDWQCATAIRAARRVYSAIGDRLRRNGCDVLAGRVFTSRAEKLALVARAVACSVAEAPLRALRRNTHRPPQRMLRAADAVRLA